jgi:hypothetical protein
LLCHPVKSRRKNAQRSKPQQAIKCVEEQLRAQYVQQQQQTTNGMIDGDQDDIDLVGLLHWLSITSNQSYTPRTFQKLNFGEIYQTVDQLFTGQRFPMMEATPIFCNATTHMQPVSTQCVVCFFFFSIWETWVKVETIQQHEIFLPSEEVLLTTTRGVLNNFFTFLKLLNRRRFCHYVRNLKK